MIAREAAIAVSCLVYPSGRYEAAAVEMHAETSQRFSALSNIPRRILMRGLKFVQLSVHEPERVLPAVLLLVFQLKLRALDERDVRFHGCTA